jgi:hypothetical protein
LTIGYHPTPSRHREAIADLEACLRVDSHNPVVQALRAKAMRAE